MDFKLIEDRQLLKDIVVTSKKEKYFSTVFLFQLEEIDRRKLYCDLAYGSMWDYLMGEFDLTRSQTQTRICAVRFIRGCARAREAVASGELSLTAATLLGGHVRQEEKDTGEKYTLAQKNELVDLAKRKSVTEIEKILHGKKSRMVKYKITISEETKKLFEEFKELKGAYSDEEVIVLCLKEKLAAIKNQVAVTKSSAQATVEVKEVSVTKKTVVAKKTGRYIAAAVKRKVLERAHHQCEHVNPETGKRCTEKRFLEFDHREPFSAFSSTIDVSSEDNVRLLCHNHNIRSAVQYFGVEKIDYFRSGG